LLRIGHFNFALTALGIFVDRKKKYGSIVRLKILGHRRILLKIVADDCLQTIACRLEQINFV
jgi:hypothetical protein